MSRKLCFTDEGWEDYQFWLDDRKTLKKVNALIKEARRTPAEGAGDPHELHGDLAGFWARNISKKDRLVYAFDKDSITVIQARFHYDDH
ncbi:Txe/YoeB family addiction module toxin [Dyella sedimenti]|uniref:Txe/YoeB family addiction module toxin n=1 Tax=Dyella sedimenti TaxID=2919947 RepID=UPI001FA972CD|nr:Txe/YoeB family addiction module toxin [Dyella sedimenti]